MHWLKYDISNKIKLTLKNYRNNIGYVEQRPILLNDTIRNNILVGRSHISDEIIRFEKNGKFFSFATKNKSTSKFIMDNLDDDKIIQIRKKKPEE